MRNNIKPWGLIVSLLCLSIVCLLLIIAGVFTIPRLFGYEVYAVVSDSMERQYPVGSIIFTKRSTWEQISAGDCITYQYGGQFVTHRVIEIDSEAQCFITKGDSNQYVDTPVAYEQLVGRTETILIPRLGYIAIWIRGEHNMGRSVGICAFSICLLIWKFGNRRRKRNEKRVQALYYRASGGDNID